MKTALLCIFMLSSAIIFAQEQQASNTPLSHEQIQSIKMEIFQTEYHIKAIQTKKEFVMNNAEEKALAEEKGWFDQMNRIEGQLNEKLQNLKNMIEE